MSAEAAKAAFAVIKDSMAGKPREMKGKLSLRQLRVIFMILERIS